MGHLLGSLQVQVVLVNCLTMVASLTYYTTEELPAGTLIGNVIKDKDLKSKISPGNLGQLKFSFLVHGYPDSQHFTIGQRTSEIRTKHKLDREKLCMFKTKCALDIVVGVLSDRSDFYEVVPIEVIISDVNDNAPRFPKEILQVSIPESATMGSRHIIPTAIDPDLGNNTIQTYQLLTSNKLFSLEVTRDTNGRLEPFLILTGEIDREKSESYQLEVVAIDGGKPPKLGKVKLNISVTDVNDHTPQFTQQRYEVSFRENTKVGRTMLRVQAKDSDDGPNGQVSYKFGPQTSEQISKTFSINESNGKIKLESKLDYETIKQYQFHVIASDHGNQPKTAQAEVLINVEDINDNVPSLHFNLLSGGDYAMLLENATLGSFIAHLSVEDNDDDRFGKVACRASPEGFILKRLYGKEYSVLLNRTLDREIWQSYEVRVSCQDGGNPPETGSGSFHIEVMDVNDNPPLFQPPNYKKTIRENNHTEQFVVQVFTTDKDAGENRNVSYTLLSHQNLFSVDSNGIITSKAHLDREQYPTLKLIVVAKDHGHPSQSATSVVDIKLEDVNDNRPVFIGDYEMFHVLENEPSGTYVGKVTATDRDEGKNGQVTYSLIRNLGSPIVPFSIDSYGGVIRTTEKVDREKHRSFMLTIMAEDRGEIRKQNSIITIPVLVGDTNDNDPFFTFPNENNDTINLYHTAYVGTCVTIVKARDLDKGENATIIYKIVSGNQQKKFQIDETSGEVFLVKDLVKADVGQQFLFVSASDSGTPPRRNSAKLLLNIHLGNITHLSSFSKDKGTAVDSMIIGISLALTAILLAIIIIITIVIVRIRRRKRTNEDAAQAEAEHMMPVSTSDHGGFGVLKSPKQNTLTKNDSVIQQSQFTLRPDIQNNCHYLPSPTFSTFTGQNSYMASIDHHSNVTYPQDSGAVNIADRVPPDGQDIELNTIKYGGTTNSPSYETYQTLEREPMKRQPDIPHLPDVLQKLDAHSDISGETTASDSGRGGSEEDTKHSLNNNIKGCDKTGKSRVKKTKLGQLMRPVLLEEDTVNQRIKTWMAEQHPEHNFYSQSNVQPANENSEKTSINPSISDQGISCDGTLSPSETISHKNRPSWRVGELSPHNTANSPKLERSGQLKTRSEQDEDETDILNDSLRDDDDGGTTTSGSYVVSPEDICDINELYSHDIPGVDV